jgi:hypothetical protein
MNKSNAPSDVRMGERSKTVFPAFSGSLRVESGVDRLIGDSGAAVLLEIKTHRRRRFPTYKS